MRSYVIIFSPPSLHKYFRAPSNGSNTSRFNTGIVLNEILPSPDGPDAENEWIEVFNQNNFEVDLSGWKIRDKEGKTTTYTFSANTKISPLGYLVLKRTETKTNSPIFANCQE